MSATTFVTTHPKCDAHRVVALLAFSDDVRRTGRSGVSIIQRVATIIAVENTQSAVAFLRGLWYAGITTRGSIDFTDFRTLVSLTETDWEDFTNI